MKIDESYAQSPKWKGGEFLLFAIEELPKVYSTENVPPFNRKGFAHFDDEKIIIKMPSNKPSHKGFSNMLFIGAAIIFVGPELHSYFEEGEFRLNLFVLVASLIIISYGSYLRYKATTFPEHIYLTLYRLRGLIELPRNDESLDSFVIRFSDLKAIKKSITTPNVHISPQIMFIRDASTRLIPKAMNRIGMSWSNNPMEYWSFYVWYMDKNRPLPPGTAFDPYREKDYERRKAEGFPPPLFPSEIPTPEYVFGKDSAIADKLI